MIREIMNIKRAQNVECCENNIDRLGQSCAKLRSSWG
jgi:hypothetical protein